jgi:hypothetical protein
MRSVFRRSRALALSAACASVGAAQVPQYSAEVTGPATLVNDINEHGEVVGWALAGGTVRAYLARPGGQPYELLPLPPGHASSWAQGVNDAGVVVGSSSKGSLPEFGQAVAWFPDGAGGYTTQFLGQLPGHTQSVAYDVNNVGQIVGTSILPGMQGGPTVWFNAPGGLLDISALGAPGSPKQVNDAGIVVGISGGLFDLGALQALPLPALPGNWSGFQGWAISDVGGLAGTAFLGGVARAPAIWTSGGGWQTIGPAFSLSSNVQAFDLNDDGVAVAEIPQPAAYFPQVGTVGLASLLIPSQQGQWSFSMNFGNAINDQGQIAAIGMHLQSGASGVVLLTPVAGCEAPTVYCTSKVTSSGCVPQIAASGAPSLSAPAGFTVTAGQLEAQQNGIQFFGQTIHRLPVKSSGGGTGCSGSLAYSLAELLAHPSGGPRLVLGQSVHQQCWFRDPPAASTTGLSNAITYTLCP